MTHYGVFAATAEDPIFQKAVAAAAVAKALKVQAGDPRSSSYDQRMAYGREVLNNPSGMAPAIAITVATALRAESSFMEQEPDAILSGLDSALDAVWDALAGVTPVPAPLEGEA